jgi:hypothetical protein
MMTKRRRRRRMMTAKWDRESRPAFGWRRG